MSEDWIVTGFCRGDFSFAQFYKDGNGKNKYHQKIRCKDILYEN